jgi:hypothetical protein
MLAEIHVSNDAYALFWLLGVTLLVGGLMILGAKAIAKWLVLIEEERVRKQAEDDLLARAITRGMHWGVDYSEIERRIVANMTPEELARARVDTYL